jgi:hypothetical protein
MSKSKIVGIIGLIAFAMGILFVGNGLAGEKFKWRAVWYSVKVQSVDVPGEEGRIMVVREDKGILTVLQGSKLMDGMAGVHAPFLDVNTKTGAGFGHGVILFTDRDGNKMYCTWEGKGEKGLWSGPGSIVRGTGKFEGVKGKATFSTVVVAPNQFYAEWDGEIELPR